jgi:hypothetical protein
MSFLAVITVGAKQAGMVISDPVSRSIALGTPSLGGQRPKQAELVDLPGLGANIAHVPSLVNVVLSHYLIEGSEYGSGGWNLFLRRNVLKV